MLYENQSFIDRDVRLDANEFINCHFERCTLRFAGGPTRFERPSVHIDCTLALDGSAVRTVNLLKSLDNAGMGWIVKPVIDDITSGSPIDPEDSEPRTSTARRGGLW